MRIREIAQARVRYGYRKIRVLLNREGWDVGKYLVYRLYTEEGLSLKRMKPAGKRNAARQREERFKPAAQNQAWSMDFVADQLQDGTRFRSLTRRCVHARSGGHRGWAEPKRRRCRAHTQQVVVRSSSTESAVL
jgi:putative transposase